MRMLCSRLAAVFCFALLLQPLAPARAQTLDEVLSHVYENNPTLLAARAALEVVNEQVPQARAAWIPSLTFTDAYARSNTITEDDGNGSTLSDTRTDTLSLSQTLFSFSNLASLTAADRQVENQRYTLAVSEQTALLGGVTAYMNVLRDRNIVDLRRNNVKILEQRLDSTRVQYDLRLRTEADLAQARSRLARAQADLAAAQGNYDKAISNFVQVVGYPPKELVAPVFSHSLPEGEDQAVTTATDLHPSVQAADKAVAQAEADVDVNQGNRLPNLALAASIAKTHTDNHRDQSTESMTKTATVTLTVPIFQAGTEFSNVRSAKKTVRQRKLEFDQARRTARDNARQAWEDLITAEERVKAFDVQVGAAKIALDGVIAEQEVGRRTVLDVLDAEQEYLDAQVNLATAKRDDIVARFTLLERTGKLRARDLGLAVQFYDVERDLKRQEWNLFTTDID